jgi:hypothetical protein
MFLFCLEKKLCFIKFIYDHTHTHTHTHVQSRSALYISKLGFGVRKSC